MYAIFKSMTKFSKFQLEDILILNGLNNSYKDIKELNSHKTVIPEIKDKTNIINYLGFSFDGSSISICQKTYGKYI